MDTKRTIKDLRAEIAERRRAIRLHRDQRGDDRCWLDDHPVWAMLDDTPPEPAEPPPYDESMRRCREFYRYRRAETADPVPKGAIADPGRWDDDLAPMSERELAEELKKLQAAIARHRDVEGRSRTADDDRALYLVLPERLPADFRLPPEAEFIGGVKAGSGCPNFWKSHEGCPVSPHDLHRWGPCAALPRHKRPKVGVGVMILKDGKVLLGKRKGAHGEGEYAFPGGHLESMESFEDCARREVGEECGIAIGNVRFQFLANVVKYAPKHYVHVGLSAEWKSGTPELREPEKSESWDWYALDGLPSPLFEMCRLAVHGHRTGKNYYDIADVSEV